MRKQLVVLFGLLTFLVPLTASASPIRGPLLEDELGNTLLLHRDKLIVDFALKEATITTKGVRRGKHWDNYGLNDLNFGTLVKVKGEKRVFEIADIRGHGSTNPNWEDVPIGLTLNFKTRTGEMALDNGDIYNFYFKGNRNRGLRLMDFDANTASNAILEPATNPVPEPAAMLLFGTGLAGLAGMIKRKSTGKKVPSRTGVHALTCQN